MPDTPSGDRRSPPHEAGSYLILRNPDRYLRPGLNRPAWVKMPLADLIDDDDLQALPVTTRLVFYGLIGLAARAGGTVRNDPRWIAGKLGLATRSVTLAIKQLTNRSRIDEVLDQKSVGTDPNQLAINMAQPSAFAAASPIGHPPGHPPGSRARDKTETRALTPNRTNVQSNAAPVLPSDSQNGQLPEALRRLVAHAAKGDPKSEAIIVREATGLPEAAWARTLESLLARRPRPTNPAGYVVQTLRRIRTEGGHPPIESVTFDPEPDL